MDKRYFRRTSVPLIDYNNDSARLTGTLTIESDAGSGFTFKQYTIPSTGSAERTAILNALRIGGRQPSSITFSIVDTGTAGIADLVITVVYSGIAKAEVDAATGTGYLSDFVTPIGKANVNAVTPLPVSSDPSVVVGNPVWSGTAVTPSTGVISGTSTQTIICTLILTPGTAYTFGDDTATWDTELTMKFLTGTPGVEGTVEANGTVKVVVTWTNP